MQRYEKFKNSLPINHLAPEKVWQKDLQISTENCTSECELQDLQQLFIVGVSH